MPHPRIRRFRPFAAAVLGLVFALAASACQPQPIDHATEVPEPSLTRPARFLDEIFPVQVTRNLHYATAEDLDGDPVVMALDLYQPQGDTAGQRPAVVVAHGGGFFIGSRTGGVETALARHFAATGYVAVSIDYRLLAHENCGLLGGDITPESGCLTAASAAISDGAAAVRWLRANAETHRVDPDRIVMIGPSAGAIMAIGVGVTWGAIEEYTDAAGSPEPPNPLVEALLFGAPPNTSNAGHLSRITAWSSIAGAFPDQVNQLDLPRLVADNWPHALPAPGILFHGTADDEVLYPWGETLRDQLSATGRAVVWKGFDGLGHVSSLWGNVRATIEDETTWFFAYALGLVAPPA